MFAMKPIQRKSLAQEVAEQLRHQITSQAIKVGEKLPTEPELMQSFGVGRSTIREAIKYLEQSSFIKVQQGIGTLVVSQTGNMVIDHVIDNSNYAEAFEVRQLLELRIVEKAAIHRKEEHLQAMRESLDNRYSFAKQHLLKESIEADIVFHTIIAESCGNTILHELYKTLSAHIAKHFINDYEGSFNPLASQKLHEELFIHLQNKDARAAVEISKKIIRGF